MEKVTGYIHNFIYQNQENGYTVLTLHTDDGELTCVGMMNGVSEGMIVEFSGRYTAHPSYGRQFRVETYEEKEPEDEAAYLAFLENASARLHAEGYFMNVDLAPKTSAGKERQTHGK